MGPGASTLGLRNSHTALVLPCIVLNPPVCTLPVGITLYQDEFTFSWPIISAGLIVAIAPIAVLIGIFQERVVGGLTQGSLKG